MGQEDDHKLNRVNSLIKYFRIMLLGFIPLLMGCFLLPSTASEEQLFSDLAKRLRSSNELEAAFSKLGVQFNGFSGFTGKSIPRVVIVIYIYLDKAVEPPEEVLEFIRNQKREMGLQNTIIIRFAVGPIMEGKVYAKRKV